jgi:signal transduction histidine kinase
MQSLDKIRVLIVHDAGRSADGLAALLEKQACEVIERQWDAKHIQEYKQVVPGIIIFDIPKGDDCLYEACQTLSSYNSPIKPVIILLSRLPTSENNIQAFESGVADIVCPPVDLRELAARIMARIRNLRYYYKLYKETKVLEKEVVSKTGKLMMAFRTGKTCLNGDIKKNEQVKCDLQKGLASLSSRIIAIEESNCNRLARELHDCIGQNMTALKLNLNLIRQQLSSELPRAVEQRLNETIELAAESTQKIREIMTALRCKVLDYDGLLAALRWEGNRFATRTGLRVDILGAPIEPRPSPEVETALFRIAQEAMTNVFKHASAKQVVITLNEKHGVIYLSIADDGKGFDPEKRAHKPDSSWGLIHMQERVEAQQGVLRIISGEDEGTHIIAAVPR